MSAPSYAIMRFAKYKGPEIGRIEAHNQSFFNRINMVDAIRR